MFKQRLLTALILIPLVLLTIKQANPWILAEFMAIILAIAAKEWFALIPLKQMLYKILFSILLIVSVYCCWIFYDVWFWTAMGMWCLVVIAMMTFPRSQKLWGHPSIVAVVCLILLPLVFVSMSRIYIAPQGQDWMIYLLFLVWATDTGGYFIGKRWGKHRLIPQVSPGKTVEGTLGGFFLAMFVAGIGRFWFAPSVGLNHGLTWFVFAGVVFGIAVLGDLLISMLKRRVQLKDTGSLIPGHGGVLDRLDSLIAAAPFFYAGLHFIWT